MHRHALIASEQTEVEGLPVTTLVRTVADLLLSIPRDPAAVAVESLIFERRLTLDEVADLPLLVRGRHGVRRAIPTLQSIRAGAESPLETLSRLRFSDLGLEASVIQPVIVGPQGEFLGRGDLGFGGMPPVVIGEADGAAVHEGRQMRAHDARREERLRLAGHEVVRWTWDELVSDAPSIVARIRAFAAKHGVAL